MSATEIPLAVARLRAGLTQQALADAAGVSIATVRRCEQLGRWPKCPAMGKALLAACKRRWPK